MNITILDVIKCMIMGNNEAAMAAYSSLYGVSYAEARIAVEAFNGFVVLPEQKPTEASQQAPEAILEPSRDERPLGQILQEAWEQTKNTAAAGTTEDKPAIDKWIVTSVAPNNARDYWDWTNSEDYALTMAKSLIEGGHTQVRISRVIAEAQEKTVYTIEL